MDGLSIACAVLASIHAVRRTFQLFDAAHNAPREATDLRAELEAIDDAVSDVTETLRESRDDTSKRYGKVLNEPLKSIGNDVESLQAYLRKVLPKGSQAAGRLTNVERLLWVKGRSKLKEHTEMLSRRKLNLLVAMGSVGISAAARIETVVDDISTSMPKQTMQLKLSLQDRLVAIEVSQEQSTAFMKQIRSICVDLQQPALSEQSQPSGSNETPDIPIVQLTTSTNALMAKLCLCKCHRKRNIESPDYVQPVVGKIQLITSVDTTCDRDECRGQCSGDSFSSSFTWRLPRWSPLQRAIAFAVETTFFQNPKYCLSFPRLVSGDAAIFHLATTGNVTGMKSLLLSGKASPNDQKFDSGFTALHYAVLSERVEVCEFLLKARCNLSLPTAASVTATDYALTKVLGRREDNANTKGLREIFNLSEAVQDREYTLLHEIVLGFRSGASLEEAILDNPELINVPDAALRTPLSWAAQRGDSVFTRLLLEYHAEPNIADAANMTPLHYSTYAQEEECLKEILNAGAQTDIKDTDRGWLPIHYAAFLQDNANMIGHLLLHGSNVDDPTTSGKTPLVLATLKNHSKAVARILQAEPSLDLADTDGWAPLNSAIASKSIESLQMLINAGIDLTQLCWASDTVLHLLARYPSLATMECIMNSSLEALSLDALDRSGETASAILQAQKPPESIRQAFRALLRKVHDDNRVKDSVDADEQERWEDAVELLDKQPQRQ